MNLFNKYSQLDFPFNPYQSNIDISDAQKFLDQHKTIIIDLLRKMRDKRVSSYPEESYQQLYNKIPRVTKEGKLYWPNKYSFSLYTLFYDVKNDLWSIKHSGRH